MNALTFLCCSYLLLSSNSSIVSIDPNSLFYYEADTTKGKNMDEESYVILNNGKEISKQLKFANKTYIIQHDFVLSSGEDKKKQKIIIPKNCTLKFDGGRLNNAVIFGNNTSIEAGIEQIFDDSVTIQGSWNVIEAYPEWFGAKADGVSDDTQYVQKALSLNSSFLVISKGIRFNLRKLVFNKNVYLVYFADSEIGEPHGYKRKSGELTIYSANSSYPTQESGGEVNEIRFQGQLHPAFVADVRKDVHGHDHFIAPDQEDNIARVSYQIEDEEIPRAAFHYKNNYSQFDNTSGIHIQANRTVVDITGVGIKSWKKAPSRFDYITQKDDDDNVIAGGYILSQDNYSTTVSWCQGRFHIGRPLFFGGVSSKTKVVHVKRIDEGLASINSTNYKNGWAVGVPASISDAMFTVGGRVYAVNTDMYGNSYQLSEPGYGFRYYTSLSDENPRERLIVLDKFNSANRRLFLKNETGVTIGMVGACSAFSKLFVYRGELVKSYNSYNIESVSRVKGFVGKYRVSFAVPMHSNTYSVSLTSNDPMIYCCVSEESTEGFVIELYLTGTKEPVDLEEGGIHISCFGGDY